MEIIIPRDTPAFSFPRGPRPPDFPKTPQSANLSTPRRINTCFYLTALSATPSISRIRRGLEGVFDGTEQNRIFVSIVEVCLLAWMCPPVFVITKFKRHGLSFLVWLGSLLARGSVWSSVWVFGFPCAVGLFAGASWSVALRCGLRFGFFGWVLAGPRGSIAVFVLGPWTLRLCVHDELLSCRKGFVDSFQVGFSP